MPDEPRAKGGRANEEVVCYGLENVTPRRSPWHRSAMRAELMALYGETDALVEGGACACSPAGGGRDAARCCHFAVIGREPYPTAIELEEVRHAMRGQAGAPPRNARKLTRNLPVLDRRPCPLLSSDGRCRIYASRPFGCRTFFCPEAEPLGGGTSRSPRSALRSIGGRIADLSARFAPHDPHPRPLTRALTGGGRPTHDR